MTSQPRPPLEKVGVIIVDHGSKRAASNEMLLEVVEMFRQSGGFAIVEPAHMELEEPSLQTAFDCCVAQGAETVVIHPYFLLPGNHSQHDIPALAAEAAVRHPGVRFLVTAPLGLHPLMVQIMRQRIAECLESAKSGELRPIS
jgi:sirohydrochlorin ferrochelatase